MIEFSILGIVFALIIIAITYFSYVYKINWIVDLTMEDDKSLSTPVKYNLKKNRDIGKLPPVYPNGWFQLLNSWELKKSQVKHVTALGQNFAVFRTVTGAVRILDAYCPHMGANMAIDGKVKGEELECPFHLWRFCGESGKCTKIPYSKTNPGSIKTKVWECVEVNDIIFVWYHAESESPDWYPEKIENIANGKLKYQGRNEFYINCVIQDVAENASDPAHFVGIHGSPIIPFDFFRKIMHHSWETTSWRTKSSEHKKDDDQPAESNSNKIEKHHMIEICLDHSLILLKKLKLFDTKITIIQMGLSHVVNRVDCNYGPMYLLVSMTPIKPILQKVVHTMYAPFLASPYWKIGFIMETLMFQRDVDIWNHKKFLEKPIILGEEKCMKSYRKWAKQFYSDNSPTFESLKEQSIEW